MTDLKRMARMSLTLGVLSLFGLGASVFALNNIAQGDTNLTMAWAVLRVTAFILLMFIAISFVTLVRIIRHPEIS